MSMHIRIAFILSITLFSIGCSGTQSDDPTSTETVGQENIREETKELEVTGYMTWVKNARVREYPNFNSKVIDVLDRYEKIYHYGDPSEILEKATLKGKSFTDVFYQIEYDKNKVGWLHGACIQPVYNLEVSEIVQKQLPNELKELNVVCPNIHAMPINWSFAPNLTTLHLYLDPMHDCDKFSDATYPNAPLPEQYFSFLENLDDQLRELHIGEIDVPSSAIEKYISKLKNLRSLSCYNTNLQGDLPRDLLALQELRELDVHCNKNLSIENIVSSFPKLEILKIGSTSGPLLPIYCENMKQLKRVEFLLCDGESELDFEPVDQVPVNIHALKNIEEIHLEGYTPEIIDEIKKILPNVKMTQAYTKKMFTSSK